MTHDNNSSAQFDKMINAPVTPLIAKLAVPTTLTMLVTSIYNLVDTAFVGQIGTSASAAVGVVFAFMAIIQACGFVFGHGSGSIISRALGARDHERANRTATTAIFCSIAFGALLSVISWCFVDRLIRVLGSTETIAPYARTYISYILAAAPFMTSSFTMNQILRFEGKATLGMIAMMTGGILNMIGDPILIFGFHMGIAGAGLATCLSQIVGFCLLMSMFLRGKSVSRIGISWFSKDPDLILDIVTTGLPSLVRQGLISVGTLILNHQAAPYGDAAIAAISIVNRISGFLFAIALGIGQGFQPVCGFNYGAARYDRVQEGYKATVRMGTAAMGAAVIVLLVFSGRLIGLFRDDPEVIAIGTRALRIQGTSLLVIPFTLVTEMMYQSTGRKAGAMILSLARGGMFFIPLLMILSRLRGLHGIQEAQACAYVVTVPLAWIYVRKFFDGLPGTKH